MIGWNLTYVPSSVDFAMEGAPYLYSMKSQIGRGDFDLGLLYYDDPLTGYPPELQQVRQSIAFHTQVPAWVWE